jgi:TolB-like protein/DNA-binding SARP family transcriptional activator/Flp pilus assembly protein TadD
MPRLTVLGGLTLSQEGAAHTGRAGQKRRLALLALLAVPPARPVPRERLVGYLWAENTDEKARHSLSAALSDLRREIGDEAVQVAGDAVAMDSRVLSCDAAEFMAALDDGRLEDAVALYGGPFLDGFFIPGALELDRWVEVERERYAASYRKALEALAVRADERGDAGGAVEAWRRLASEDRLSSRVALAYMRALDAAGDRAAALRFARVHAALLREELGTEPDPEVQELEDRLRQAPPPHPLAGHPAPGGSGGVEPRPPPPSLPMAARGVDEQVNLPVAAGATAPGVPAGPGLAGRDIPVDRAAARVRGRPGTRAQLAGAAVGAALVVSLIVLVLAPRYPAVGVAVMPFENVGGNPDQEYFADGLTDEILTALSRIESLRVTARTSSFMYKGRAVDVREAARQLGVRYVVGGSVRRDGDRLRISSWLVDPATGFELWSESYDRFLGSVFDTQEEIARAIATALQPRLGASLPTLVQPSTRDTEAYSEYLKGRARWYSRAPADLQPALAHFHRALTHDSTYSLAYVGIADVYNTLGAMEWAVLPPGEAYGRSADAAHRALALDPGLGEGHAALATALFNHQWNLQLAEQEYRRALEINPGNVMARHWYSLLLRAAGRPADALEQILQARQLDPRSAIVSSSLARHYYFERQWSRSAEEFATAILLDPTSALPHVGLGMAAAASGDAGRALEAYREAERLLDSNSPVVASLVGHALGLAGEAAQALHIYTTLQAQRSARYVPPHALAVAALGAGEHEQAIAWLEAAVAERSPAALYARVDPILDPLREAPRFRLLMAEVERLTAPRARRPARGLTSDA